MRHDKARQGMTRHDKVWQCLSKAEYSEQHPNRAPVLQQVGELDQGQLHEPIDLVLPSLKVLDAEGVYGHHVYAEVQTPLEGLYAAEGAVGGCCGGTKHPCPMMECRTCLSLSKPAEWPASLATWRFLAKRRLPSIIKATWVGTGPALSVLMANHLQVGMRSCLGSHNSTPDLAVSWMLCRGLVAH